MMTDLEHLPGVPVSEDPTPRIAANPDPARVVVIAERHLQCSFPDSPMRDVRLLIHAPVREPDGTGWRCVAALENLFKDVATARGVDSLQALQLVLREVGETLEAIRQAGGTVGWQDGSGELSDEDLLK